MNKKAQVGIYLTFIIISIVIIMIAAVFAPLGVLFNTEMYKAGEGIILQANQSISSINNTEVRDAVQASLAEATAATQNNIEINADIFQYSWILIVGLTALVLFLYTRKIVEFQGGGFV